MSRHAPPSSAPGQGTPPRSRWQRRLPVWMTRDISLLVGARSAMSASRALAGVLVPIYLAQIGYSAQVLGILFAIVAVTSAVLSAIIGMLSDRIGRKPFIVVIPLLTAVAAVLFTTTRVTALLFLFAAVGTFGRGAGAGAGAIGPYQPAEQAYLADSVESRFRNNLFGVVGLASSVGALIGGPLALLADVHPFGLSKLSSDHLVFVIMGALALLAGLLAIPVDNRKPVPYPVGPPVSRSRARRMLPRLSIDSWATLRKLWVTNVINGFAVGFFGPFITLWFYERYGASAGTIGVLFAIINLFALLSNLGAAPAARRLGLVRAIMIGRSLQAVLLIPMVLAPSFWLAGAIYLLRMLAQRLALPLRQSFVMGVVPPEERGAVGALANLPSQASSAISPALAGWIFYTISLNVPFVIGGVLQGVNAVCFYLFFRGQFPPEEQERAALAGKSARSIQGGTGIVRESAPLPESDESLDASPLSSEPAGSRPPR